MDHVSLINLVSNARQGKLVSFPTDTVPALATVPEFAELIFTAKQRSQDKPLILMAATTEELWNYVVGSPEECQEWQSMMDKYLPGALTLVLPASKNVPKNLNPQQPNTIGVRIPKSAIAQTILSQTGALATTSANLSGQPALLTMEEIAVQFPDVATLDPREFASEELNTKGVPSTVIKWTGKDWQILRQGAVILE
ncbi:L-threonylcarbamoyladenylate synthase [Calothrix sp. PCC 6303]|uniref:L-threonylcarbamoyladenylate synthase n=1 Tax=Calothrix sp. PCC 6303 TaxID=1170562 RepID=UPI0002A0042E|nr:L-threonylcarbamoyladenylate synthase [Calothrix sp. PCC 6303]AFZ01950.1 SUA5/yciO/yrdC domain protein [Calothrix sp. PCC 6303]